MLKVKRWVPVKDRRTGIGMELKRPSRVEARPLQRHLFKMLSQTPDDQSKLTVMQQADVMDKVISAIPEEEVRGWFRDFVRNVEEFTIDGEAIKEGEALYEYADDMLICFVLGELVNLSRISASEGKGSASPSTSSVAVGTTDGGSPAPSTEREAGPTPSTVVPMRHAAS